MGKKSMGEASKGAFPREYGEKLLRFADSFNKVFFIAWLTIQSRLLVN